MRRSPTSPLILLTLAACDPAARKRETETTELRIEAIRQRAELAVSRQAAFLLCLDAGLSTEMQPADIVAAVQQCIARAREAGELP